MELVTKGESTVFLQPCRFFSCGQCAVYLDRPKVCRNFRCDLLKRYQAGEVDLSEARATVEKALELVAEAKIFAPEAARYRDRRRLRAKLAERMVAIEGGDRRRLARQLLNLIALDAFLESRFRRRRKATSASPPAVAN